MKRVLIWIVLLLCLVYSPLIALVMLVCWYGMERETVYHWGSELGSVPFSARSFTPHPLTCMYGGISGHLQTLSVMLKRGEKHWWDERTTLPLRDDPGASIGLWVRNGRHGKMAPVLVMFPGLTGDSGAPYCLTAINHLKDSYRIFLAVAPGCGDSKLGRRPYNAHETRWVRSVLMHVAEVRCPSAPVFVLGFSLGANLVTRCLAEHAEAFTFLKGAAVVGSPWNLKRSSRVMEDNALSRFLFAGELANGLLEYFERNRSALVDRFDFDASQVTPQRVSSVLHFDEVVTAPAGGFKNVDHYYEEASTHELLEHIRVPLLCVSAADDAVVDGRGMPLTTTNELVALVLAPHGGHLGFTEASWSALSVSWADRVVKDFFSTLPH